MCFCGFLGGEGDIPLQNIFLLPYLSLSKVTLPRLCISYSSSVVTSLGVPVFLSSSLSLLSSLFSLLSLSSLSSLCLLLVSALLQHHHPRRCMCLPHVVLLQRFCLPENSNGPFFGFLLFFSFLFSPSSSSSPRSGFRGSLFLIKCDSIASPQHSRAQSPPNSSMNTVIAAVFMDPLFKSTSTPLSLTFLNSTKEAAK